MVSDIVLNEVERASSKYPSFNSPHEGYAVLLEEVDELWDEVKADNIDLACAEAIQVAAMAIRFVVDLSAGKMPAPMLKPEDAPPISLSLRSTDAVSCTFGTPAELLSTYAETGTASSLADLEACWQIEPYLDETLLDYLRHHNPNLASN
jgi:hypothetical protein